MSPRKTLPPGRTAETVALGQEVLERPGAGVEGASHRAVTAREPSILRAPVRADASVADLVSDDVAGHLRVEVGQAEGDASEADGYGVVGVQAEEPDAGFALGRDVGAHVQFREVERGGTLGKEWGRVPLMRNGVMPSQALPSKVSR
jgi:hypothetical protein